mmetsp:Transcript_12912/g.36322  ORF Transcript_12912/g.36322 Transcript_12912/m.36322 type:complete len:211 (+) Transcript_12912:2044-2676(+)
MVATDFTCCIWAIAFFSAVLKVFWLASMVRRCFSSCFFLTVWCTEALAWAPRERSTSTRVPFPRPPRFCFSFLRWPGSASPSSPSSDLLSLLSSSSSGSLSISVILFLCSAMLLMRPATGLPALRSAFTICSSSAQSRPLASAALTALMAASTASKLRWISSARCSWASASFASCSARLVWSAFTRSSFCRTAFSCCSWACSAFWLSILE